jgi:hypothetical protein
MFKMRSKTYNGEVRTGEKDFETLQLGAFATPGLLLAQGPAGLTAESGLNDEICRSRTNLHDRDNHSWTNIESVARFLGILVAARKWYGDK